MTKILVTGGVRSGKSRWAEQRCSAWDAVTFITPGYPVDAAGDPEWAARVAAHQLRRPASWTTVETPDVASAIAASEQPCLVDCLGTWVTRTVDAFDAWEEPLTSWQRRFDAALDALVEAWTASPQPLVAVTNEVGWGVVSEHRAGRTFADLLGRTNQAIAAHCDEVVLMVAGRPLAL